MAHASSRTCDIVSAIYLYIGTIVAVAINQITDKRSVRPN
jgi:hypothetical protein